jgi:hypothetical protein
MKLVLVLLLLADLGMLCPLHGQAPSATLNKELSEKSKKGLALAAFDLTDGLSLRFRFLDGRQQNLALGCCTRIASGNISRNRLIFADLSTAPAFDGKRLTEPSYNLAWLLSYGGPLVVLNAKGEILKRSIARFNAFSVALSFDESHFAFVGTPLGKLAADTGVYIGDFKDPGLRMLMRVPDQGSVNSAMTRDLIDWSPDGAHLLFSNNGIIWLVDVLTGRLRKLVAGGGARWSPASDWISCITTEEHPALFNVSTGASRTIDSDGDAVGPPEWSPDGQYLILHELLGKPITGSRFSVYRVSDGAFAKVSIEGIGDHNYQWIQLP